MAGEYGQPGQGPAHGECAIPSANSGVRNAVADPGEVSKSPESKSSDNSAAGQVSGATGKPTEGRTPGLAVSVHPQQPGGLTVS